MIQNRAMKEDSEVNNRRRGFETIGVGARVHLHNGSFPASVGPKRCVPLHDLMESSISKMWLRA